MDGLLCFTDLQVPPMGDVRTVVSRWCTLAEPQVVPKAMVMMGKPTWFGALWVHFLISLKLQQLQLLKDEKVLQ